MKGDFSRWSFDTRTNAHGVLHQQGRVLLDTDWNAQTRLVTRWQDEAGRAAFGAGVAAVAAEWRDSLEVTVAELLASGAVRLTVTPGRLWADGWLVHLVGDEPDPDASVIRPAVHLDLPLQTPLTDVGAAGTRDAVVLEINREALNGFQVPNELIEAALGGPDTTERLQAAFRFRLLRLADGETCDSIRDRIADDFSARGKLTVSLQDTMITPGDCPVVEGGGYTGFEHNLYRIEIAELGGAAPAPMFKWSQFNGGLVGRGSFDAATRKLTITANRQPILRSGLQSFYLEAFEPDPDRPPPPASADQELSAVGAEHWRLVYGARVTIANDDQIDLPVPGGPDELFGSIPGPADRRLFFRLWNGIRDITEFPAGSGTELRDGIQLEFEAPSGDNFLPYDYWTFDLRAGGIENDEVLIDDQPPEGVEHVRVPLAILNWTGGASPITQAAGEIDDCRRIFQPLTRLSTCCTIRVGDGIHSHGDYTTISEALLHLPAAGGRICVLPGEYHENVLIEHRRAVSIIGCGDRSRVVSAAPTGDDDVGLMADPVFHVLDSQKIRIESLAVEAHPSGIGVLIEESDPRRRDPDAPRAEPVRDVRLAHLTVEAARQSGIEVRGGAFMEIVDNRVLMADVETQWPAVTIQADDVLFEHNLLRVESTRTVGAATTAVPLPGVRVGVGGLWLRGGSERVRVIDNWIIGGIGHGITLGHIELVADGKDIWRLVGVIGWVAVADDDPCAPCGPGTGRIPPGGGTPDDPTPVAGPPLREILIERNRVESMGVNGISVIGFFTDDKQGVISIEDLTIIGNLIRGCLLRPLEDVLDEMVDRMGFGGIALADVETLTIRDNRIENNGRNHLEPICGVYVLHGEGIDLSRNLIIGNGAKTDQRAANSKQGARGGVVIQMVVAPVFEIDREQRFFPNVRGIPAVKVHDNVISAPLGQSLLINALGPVSVVANQLSSHGVYRGSQVASTVQILDLGVALEFLGAAAVSFAGLARGTVGFVGAAAGGADPASDAPPEEVVLGRTTHRAAVAAQALSGMLFNGNVLFHDNQCLLELLDRGREMALSSVAIMSLDDVSLQDNQSDCELIDDFVLINAFVIGVTTRILGNRLKEGLYNTLFSSMSWGFLNTTAHNEATHCLITMAAPNGDVIRDPNLVMIETAAFGPLVPEIFHCARWRKIFERDG